MVYNTKQIKRILCLALLGVMTASPAFAQLFNNAWSFSGQNRASIAALMKQVEGSANSGGVTSGAGATTPICGDAGGGADGGAAGASSATGNSSCIIMNNSTGDIVIEQDSQGDQTSSNDQTLTQNLDNSGDNASDALAGLAETN